MFDTSTFHQTPELAQKFIEKAVTFWKKEFETGNNLFEPRIEVASQEFIKMPCPNLNKDVDLVFQFGFLHTDQLEKIKNPSRYAGFTMRTSYDPVNLKGKGYIYIASDAGPNKFKGEKTIEMPWTYNDGGLLYWTLVHELGHLFGINHTNQRGQLNNVMANDFIETIMNPFFAWKYNVDLIPNAFFKIAESNKYAPTKHCESSSYKFPKLKKFFGIDPQWECYGISVIQEGLLIYGSKSQSNLDPIDLIGIAHMNLIEGRPQGYTFVRDALHFWIPQEQTVFKNIKTQIHTPAFFIEDRVANYKSLDNTITRKMSYVLDPRTDSPTDNDLKIGGWMDGNLYINLVEGV